MKLLRYLSRILKAISINNEKRDIEIKEGNYSEYIKGNYIQGDYNVNYIQVEKILKPTGFPQNIPRSSTDKFVGRKTELETLHEQLQNNHIAHIEGMGGIGKTELAILYCLTNLKPRTYPGGICWLRAREQDIDSQIIKFARIDLNLKPPDDLELPDQVKWCWKHWKEGNTLIVLDDVKNYGDIKDYLPPQKSQFKVLITTRLNLKMPAPLNLIILSEPEALELLKQLIGSEKVKNEPETAKILCKRLGYLPLAIQLVGQYIKEYKISLTEEIKRLEKNGLDDSSISIQEDDKTWTSDIKGVKAAFELSWQELNKSAQQLDCLLSLFALAPIPWSLVENAAIEEDLEKLKNARVKLERLNLLQGEDNYQLHQLIQEFCRDKQKNLAIANEQKSNLCRAIAEIAAEIPQTTTLSDITNLTPFIPHITETANIYQDCLKDEDLTSPFIGLGKFYQSQGAYAQALPWYQKSLSVAKNRLGEEHYGTVNSLHWLAFLYNSQGRYSEAEPLYYLSLKFNGNSLKQNTTANKFLKRMPHSRSPSKS